MTATHPHVNQPVLSAGTRLEEATFAVVLLHGRGALAEDILSLSAEFQKVETTHRIAFIAPQAAASTWYPNSFLAPRVNNEPWLSSALAKVELVVAGLGNSGITREHILLCGFSQGACLASEFIASHPTRYAGLIAFTGGLIGPLGSDLNHAGKLIGTPALLMSGDPDPHVPRRRVEESADILKQMGAIVKTEIFSGRPHTISEEELHIAQLFLSRILEDDAT